jgi:hypothetical protein
VRRTGNENVWVNLFLDTGGNYRADGTKIKTGFTRAITTLLRGIPHASMKYISQL